MKCYGKVINYDGFTGTIMGLDGNKYLLVRDNLLDNNVKEEDFVSFDKDMYRDIEITKYIARFVKRISDKDIKN